MPFRSVPASRGVDWISAGFALFRKSPLIWVVTLVIFFAILMALSLVPLLGHIAAMLLQPVLLGGLLLGCRDLDRGEELRIEHLFEGFRRDTNPLLMVGFYSGLAYLAIGLLVTILVGGGAIGLGVLADIGKNSSLLMSEAMIGFVFAGLLATLLAVPVAMATWFAPALVLFRGMPALEAMKLSFSACLGNMLPFLLYGLALMVLSVLAIIPAGLGLLVLGPTMIGSVYAGYRDIFAETP